MVAPGGREFTRQTWTNLVGRCVAFGDAGPPTRACSQPMPTRSAPPCFRLTHAPASCSCLAATTRRNSTWWLLLLVKVASTA